MSRKRKSERAGEPKAPLSRQCPVKGFRHGVAIGARIQLLLTSVWDTRDQRNGPLAGRSPRHVATMRSSQRQGRALYTHSQAQRCLVDVTVRYACPHGISALHKLDAQSCLYEKGNTTMHTGLQDDCTYTHDWIVIECIEAQDKGQLNKTMLRSRNYS